MVDVVSVLLRPLKHLLRWEHPRPEPRRALGLLGRGVVQAVTVRLRVPAGGTAPGALRPHLGLGACRQEGGEGSGPHAAPLPGPCPPGVPTLTLPCCPRGSCQLWGHEEPRRLVVVFQRLQHVGAPGPGSTAGSGLLAPQEAAGLPHPGAHHPVSSRGPWLEAGCSPPGSSAAPGSSVARFRHWPAALGPSTSTTAPHPPVCPRGELWPGHLQGTPDSQPRHPHPISELRPRGRPLSKSPGPGGPES